MTNFPPFQRTSTTGGGYAGLTAALAGLASGQLTWQQAALMAVPSVVLLLFPQDTALAQVAGVAADDVGKLISAYKMGLEHGGTAAAPLK